MSAQVPAGGEFRVNTYTNYYQERPSTASDAAGNFVVVWHSFLQDGGGHGIFAQRYDASGARRGSEFQLNTYTTNPQTGPAVASDAAGNFVAVWESYRQDGSRWGIFGQRYDRSGTRVGAEFQVNTYTSNDQSTARVASDATGNFVVVWHSNGQDGSSWGIFGQRYDASGTPLGAEFRVNTQTASDQIKPAVASDAVGNFLVVWSSVYQDGDDWGIFGRRYNASGTPISAEFRVNSYTVGNQASPRVASGATGSSVVVWDGQGLADPYGIFGQRYDASGGPLGVEFRINSHTPLDQCEPRVVSDATGNFAVTWYSMEEDGSDWGVYARRYSAAGIARGAVFRVNTITSSAQQQPAVASDAIGNFVVAWDSPDGFYNGIFAQRFGGLHPRALAVDPNGNGVLEPDVDYAFVKPSWQNLNGLPQTFGGNARSFSGPGTDVYYAILDGSCVYGTVANGATAECTDQYMIKVELYGIRPALHWDATLDEVITPDAHGQEKPWSIHVGESFTDVPKTSPFYRFVETLLHKGVTGGCGAETYCPANTVTREQMAPFVLVAREGSGYGPPACTTPMFGDVPASSPFCRWIEELARRGVVSGCGGGNYCPTSSVTREQMPIFVLRTLDPTLNPPACTTPMFGDVLASSPYCRWIEELARRGVVTGCGGGNYCPSSAVTREQMGVFISATFGLALYGV